MSEICQGCKHDNTTCAEEKACEMLYQATIKTKFYFDKHKHEYKKNPSKTWFLRAYEPQLRGKTFANRLNENDLKEIARLYLKLWGEGLRIDKLISKMHHKTGMDICTIKAVLKKIDEKKIKLAGIPIKSFTNRYRNTYKSRGKKEKI